VAEAGRSEKLLGFSRSRQSDEEQGKINSTCSIWRSPTGGCYLSDANDIKTQTHQTVRNVLSWSVLWKVKKYSFDGFFLFAEEGKIGKFVVF
jgi:hypothetical protein